MTSRRMRFAMWAGLLVLAGLLAISYTQFQAPVDTAQATATATASLVAVAPTRPGPSIQCTPERASLPVLLATDACPTAVAAVIAAVADVPNPMERIVIEPGPFFCDVIWPGVGTPRVCSMFAIQPGQWMHAWVAFRDSDAVAAVMLGLDIPDNPNAPGATRPPWRTTRVTVEVPPAGWVMP